MTENEAIQIAVNALRESGTNISESEQPHAMYKKHIKRNNAKRSGWTVMVPLNVPKSFSPGEIFVDVYEPDGEYYISPAL